MPDRPVHPPAVTGDAPPVCVAARLHYAAPMLRRAARAFVVRRAVRSWLGVIAVALPIVGAVLALEGGAEMQFGFLLASATFLVGYVMMVWRAHHRSMMSRLRAMDPPEAELTATERDITLSSSLGASTIPWARFTELWEFDDFWMLFLAPNQFFTLPLAGLDDAARGFLRSHLPTPGVRMHDG